MPSLITAVSSQDLEITHSLLLVDHFDSFPVLELPRALAYEQQQTRIIVRSVASVRDKSNVFVSTGDGL